MNISEHARNDSFQGKLVLKSGWPSGVGARLKIPYQNLKVSENSEPLMTCNRDLIEKTHQTCLLDTHTHAHKSSSRWGTRGNRQHWRIQAGDPQRMRNGVIGSRTRGLFYARKRLAEWCLNYSATEGRPCNSLGEQWTGITCVREFFFRQTGWLRSRIC